MSTATIHVLIWANEALVAGMNEESYLVALVSSLSLAAALSALLLRSSRAARERHDTSPLRRSETMTMTRLLEIEARVRPITVHTVCVCSRRFA